MTGANLSTQLARALRNQTSQI